MTVHSLFIAVFLLAIKAVTSSSRCSAINGDKCIQQCNGTKCECTGRNRDAIYTGCTQLCGRHPCNTLTCSTENCIQSCHGCKMECDRSVGFCSQRCLSGQCTIACAAKRCSLDCRKGECRREKTEEYTTRVTYPKKFLVLLAACFALTSFLSLIAITMTCRNQTRRRINRYQRLRQIPESSPSATREYRQVLARRHGTFEFSEPVFGNEVPPDALRISVLPFPNKEV
ncbi:uncharacterized protein LOC116618230 [Nematostella vectensis]|uniref:uncharacterized protein LOC116618230 n=1 Tax=Nematostella vectensis TaxID=45351 RepID=UPI0020778F37|nr:uncharacterized protein LOC116618230 [Nematostella vectensis]